MAARGATAVVTAARALAAAWALVAAVAEVRTKALAVAALERARALEPGALEPALVQVLAWDLVQAQERDPPVAVRLPEARPLVS